MKKNATPELNAKWWSSNEPDGLSSSKDLAKALDAYESTSAQLKKDVDEDTINDCLEALTQIESAAQKLQGEAEELVKSPPKKTTSTAKDYQNTADVLRKYSKIVEAARKELEKEKETLATSAAEDEESEGEELDPAGLLQDAPKYKKYLLGSMKKLLKAPMAFAFAVGSKPEDHRFICHKAKTGAALFKTLKGETELTKGTWGTAGAHELEAGVLTLVLEGKQIGALKKRGELFLKHFKPLPFHTIMLMVDGQIVEDIPDLDDLPPPAPAPRTESGLLARLNALATRIKAFAVAADAAGLAAGADLEAKKAALAPRNRLLTLVRECKGIIGKNDEQAEAKLNEIEGILQSDQGEIPAPPPAPKTQGDIPPPPPGPKAEGGLMARLDALTARIKEFAAAADAAGRAAGADLEAKKAALAPRNRLLTLVRDCKGVIGKNDEQAEAMLAQIEEILKTGRGDVSPPPASGAAATAEPESDSEADAQSDADAEGLKHRLAGLEEAYLRVMKLDPPDRSRLSALMAVSTESLQAGDLAKSASALDELEKLLQSDRDAARPVIRTTTQQVADLVADPGQLVAYRKALLQWEAARKQARGQLDGLRAAIGTQSAALAVPAAVLERVMDRLDDRLSHAIDDALNASDDDSRADLHEQAAALARNYLMTVSFDPLFKTLDDNPISPLSLRKVLGDALRQVVAALPV